MSITELGYNRLSECPVQGHACCFSFTSLTKEISPENPYRNKMLNQNLLWKIGLLFNPTRYLETLRIFFSTLSCLKCKATIIITWKNSSYMLVKLQITEAILFFCWFQGYYHSLSWPNRNKFRKNNTVFVIHKSIV